MKFCAIICEFNPLHNGHEYLIKKAKELTKLPILCLMSGNFTQRGEVAILDKNLRAAHAISAGADVVLELPTIYSIGSAEIFASGAIKILNDIGSVEYLMFGSECGDIEKLQNVAEIIVKNTKSIDKYIKNELKTGKSYPAAYIESIKKLDYDTNEIIAILDKPNNKLGIEYLKALHKYNSNIKPITIQRIGEEYNSNTISKYTSASAIRLAIESNNITQIQKSVPKYVYNDINNYINSKNLNAALLYNIRLANLKSLQNTADISEGLEYKICRSKQTNLSEFIEELKSKRYTHNRIRHIILNYSFGITKDLIKNCKNTDSYCKIVKITDKNLLKYIKNGKCIIIYSERDIKQLTDIQEKIYEVDRKADLIYSIFAKQKRDVE